MLIGAQLTRRRLKVRFGNLPFRLPLGHHTQPQRRLAGDKLSIRLHHPRRSHALQLLQLFQTRLRITLLHLPFTEFVDLAFNTVQTPDPLSLQDPLHPRQIIGTHAALGKVGQQGRCLLRQRGQSLHATGIRHQRQIEATIQLPAGEISTGLNRQPGFDQLLIKQAVLRSPQDFAEQD